MEEGLKQRLVGAAVLVFIAVIVIPIVLDEPRESEQGIAAIDIASEPSEGLGSSVIPLKELKPMAPEGALREEIAGELRAFEPAIDSAPDPVPPQPPIEQARTEEASAATGEPVAAPSSDARPAAAARADEPSAAAPQSGWVVQLASFAQPANAKALRGRLQAGDYPVFLDSVAGSNGTITRVYVGPVAERSAAKALAERLRGETRLEGMVVYRGER